MNWPVFLAQNALRGTVVLLSAFAAAAALRRASAALRSLVWSLACAVLLSLPVALLVVPKWTPLPAPSRWNLPLPVAESAPPAPVAAAHQPISRAAAPVTRALRFDWLAALWAVGCAAFTLWFLWCFRYASRLVRRARPAGYARRALEGATLALGIRRRARVLESPAVLVPLAWGVFEPTVILPLAAAEWSEDRLRAVLLHELAHTQRFDLATQAVAQAACGLYWFHPLVWLAARQFYKERERACDDAVLRHVDAPAYASHLMEVARGMAIQRMRWAGAAAMAQSSDLEARVRALLDRRRNRRPLTLRAALAAVALAFAVLLPTAVVTARAQVARPEPPVAAPPAPAVPPAAAAAQATPRKARPKPAAEPQPGYGEISGTVRDPTGAMVPNCSVGIFNFSDPAHSNAAGTNAAGEYRVAFPPGRYLLEVRAPGFVSVQRQVIVSAGLPTRADFNLELGHVSEEISVTAPKPAVAAPTPAAAASQPVPVGGKVQECTLIRRVQPAYPEDLRLAGVEGTVVVRAIITKDGDVLEPHPVSAGIDPRLVESAVAAVRQWKYRPTLLNGQPVETMTEIAVFFSLK